MEAKTVRAFVEQSTEECGIDEVDIIWAVGALREKIGIDIDGIALQIVKWAFAVVGQEIA